MEPTVRSKKPSALLPVQRASGEGKQPETKKPETTEGKIEALNKKTRELNTITKTYDKLAKQYVFELLKDTRKAEEIFALLDKILADLTRER